VELHLSQSFGGGGRSWYVLWQYALFQASPHPTRARFGIPIRGANFSLRTKESIVRPPHKMGTAAYFLKKWSLSLFSPGKLVKFDLWNFHGY